jgi:formylglycine-generating enzyme required for sulfatase activity
MANRNSGLKKGLLAAFLLPCVLFAGAFGLARLAEPLSSPDLAQKPQALRAGTVSPDGKLYVSFRNDGAAELRGEDGALISLVQGQGSPVAAAGFSADGTQLLLVDAAGKGLTIDTSHAALAHRASVAVDKSALRTLAAHRLGPPARFMATLEWNAAPWSAARGITDRSRVAPVKPDWLRPAPGTFFRDCADCPEMVVIAPGRFMMGSPEGEEGRSDDEGPQREIILAGQLAVARFEVTVAQFRLFAAETGLGGEGCFEIDATGGSFTEVAEASWARPGFDQDGGHPVSCVSWDDAQAFIDWLNRRTGLSGRPDAYRLLSEAEWEYAARAGTLTPYSFGSDAALGCGHMNGADAAVKRAYPDWTAAECDDGFVNTSPAGSFAPNAFGLYDMHGNVWEWTSDCWADDYSSGQPVEGAAFTNASCSTRVVRGGSWSSSPRGLRSALRYGYSPDNRFAYLGFRIARALPD